MFVSQNKNVNPAAKFYYAPLGFEVSSKKHFFTASVLSFGSGVNISTGYGFIWNLNSAKSVCQNIMNKRFIIKSSLDVVYDDNVYGLNRMKLGSINNDSSYIKILGLVASPTFKAVSNKTNKTFTAKNLDIGYAQEELSLLPKITIGNNPYRNGSPPTGKYAYYHADPKARIRNKAIWELSVGYNVTLYDRGGIIFYQDAGDKNHDSKRLRSPISLKTNGLTVLYNNKPIIAAPHRYSGFYISFIISAGGTKIR